MEITTDKLTNEVTSEHDGVLLKIVAQEGEDVPVKGLLCYMGQPGEQVGDAPAPAVPRSCCPGCCTAPAAAGLPPAPVAAGGATYPHLSPGPQDGGQMGVDVTVVGSGPSGRIASRICWLLRKSPKAAPAWLPKLAPPPSP